MKKYRYNINNLDCANCAREVEESLNNNKNFQNVSVNFNTLKLTYESDIDFSINELNKLVKKVEPDAFISSEEINNKKEYNLIILIIALTIGILGYYLKIPNYLKILLYIVIE